jgi:gluconate kinase
MGAALLAVGPGAWRPECWWTVQVVAIVLYGPKGAGKSQVAEVLRAQHGVAHVDADALVLDLLARGQRPHPRDGWLAPVHDAVTAALEEGPAVSVEATGAWDSDWQLADDLASAGQEVLRVWVGAPLEVTLRRLAARTTRKAPVDPREARRIWAAARERAVHHRFDLVLDTGELREEDLVGAVAPLAADLAERGPTCEAPGRGTAAPRRREERT